MNRLPLLLLVLFAFASCNKYADGPSLSLRTKKERLANTWKISQYLENDVDKTSDIMTALYNYRLTIEKKSGHYTVSYRPFNLGDYAESGNWTFVEDKAAVQFTRQSPTPVTVSTWKVLRLKEDELWGTYVDSNGRRVVVHLVPA